MKTSTTIPIAMMAAAASSQVPTSAAAAEKTSASDSDHHKKMRKLMKEKYAGLDLGILGGGERRLGKSSKAQVGCNASGRISGISSGGGGRLVETTRFNMVPDESFNTAQADPFLDRSLFSGYDVSFSDLTINPLICGETYFANLFIAGGPLCQIAEGKGLDPESCFEDSFHKLIGTKNDATGAIEFTGYLSSVDWGDFDNAGQPNDSTKTIDYFPAKLTVYFDGTEEDVNGIERQKLTSTLSFTVDVVGSLTDNKDTRITVAAKQKWKSYR